MIKTLNIWNLKWKKYGKVAIDSVIENKQKNETVITVNSKKYPFLYTSCTPEKLNDLIKADRGLYEYLLPDNKKKVFFDIDSYEKDTLEDVKKAILDTFKNARLQISGSTNGGKISYHIALSNYYIQGKDSLYKMKLWIREHPNINIDDKVYKKGMMKCINQSKPLSRKEPVKRVQAYVEGDKDTRKHLITCFFDDDAIDADKLLPPIPETEIKMRKYKKLDLCEIPQMELKKPENVDVNKATAKELLTIIPNYKRNTKGSLSHSMTWTIANYCYFNDVDFNTFWSWCQLKDNDNSRKTKWYNNHWNGSLTKVNEIKKSSIIKILQRFYPDIETPDELYHFKQYHNINPTVKVKNSYLNHNDFTKNKYQLVKIGMGGNKTGATIDYLSSATYPNFCWITPRRSLAKDTQTRILESNLDVTHYAEVGQSANEKAEEMPEQLRLIIQCESLHYLDDTTYKTIVLDEVESILNCWLSYETHGPNLKANWNTFINLLKSADRVIMLDAFLSKKTTNLIDCIEEKAQYDIIDREEGNKNNNKTLTIIKDNEIDISKGKVKNTKKLEKWIYKIVKDLKADKKLFVFYPFKRGNNQYLSMVQLRDKIVKLAGLDTDNSVVYHGDIADKEFDKLKQVNDIWKNKRLVISNTCITVGVNFSLDNTFHKVYMAWAPFVKSRDFIQVSARVRNLIDNKIVCVKLSSRLPKITDHLKHDLYRECETYKQLYDDVILEERAKTTFKAFKVLCRLAGYRITKIKRCADVPQKIQKELNKVSDDCYFKWDNITDIDDVVYEQHLLKIWSSEATLEQKLAVQKYKFREIFKECVPVEELKKFWNDKKQETFLKLYYKDNMDKSKWLYKCRENMKMSYFEIPKSFKLSEETREEIFNSFSFDIKRSSSDKLLFGRALNTFLGGNYYTTKGSSKNMTWKTTKEFDKIISFAYRYLKTEEDKKKVEN